MATRTPAEQLTADEVLAELEALEDPKIREANQRHGNDIGVNLSKLRGIAKRLKTQHEFAKAGCFAAGAGRACSAAGAAGAAGAAAVRSAVLGGGGAVVPPPSAAPLPGW